MTQTFTLSRPALLLAAALCGVLTSPAQAADYAVGGWVRADVSGFGQTNVGSQDLQNQSGTSPIGPFVLLAEGNVTGGHAQGGGAVTARGETMSRAEAGGLHLSALSGSEIIYGDPDSGEGSYAWAQGGASFADFFTLNVPGYAPGTLFSMTARVRVDASLLPSIGLTDATGWVEGVANWQAQVGLSQWVSGGQSASFLAQRGCAVNLYGPSCTGDQPGWYTLSFTMANQTMPALLSMSGLVTTRSQANIAGGGLATAGGVANLGHTIAWGGLTDLRAPDGALVTAFSAPSSSIDLDYRFAYVSAVPDVGTAVSMAAGLVLVSLQRQRRRRPG